MRPARALMISPIFPARSRNGLAMRMALFAEALEARYQLDLIVIPVAGIVAEHNAFSDCTTVSVWDAVPETHFRLLSQVSDPNERLAAFRAYGKPSLSSVLSERVLGRIAKLAAATRYDLVHVGRGYMLPVLDAIEYEVPVSVDLDEDDCASAMRMADAAARQGLGERACRLAAEAQAYDRLIAATRWRKPHCWVSNERERKSLKARHGWMDIEVVANAVDVPGQVNKQDDGRTFGFIGAFGYRPNVEGVHWFIEKVLPRMQARSSRRLRLHVAGPDAPPSLMRLAKRPGIKVLGMVPDLRVFYRSITVAIVPVRQGGGGLRTKLVEAGAHGTAFIATTVGAAGIRYTPMPSGWIATNAAEFSEACLEALDNRAERKRREQRGRHAALMFYDRRAIVRALEMRLAAIGGIGPSFMSAN